MTITATVPLLTEPVANDLDTANFPNRARVNFLEVNPIMVAINQMAAQINAESDAINALSSGAVTARAAAETAAASAAVFAATASATSSAPNWVSGTVYTAGQVRKSPIDGMPYRRMTTGAGVVDPCNDPVNWTLDLLLQDTGRPMARPSLLLDFANSGVCDIRISCVRALSADYTDKLGVVRSAAPNVPRISYDAATGECLGLMCFSGEVFTLSGADFSDWYNQSEGTFVIECSVASAPSVQATALQVNDGTASNSITLSSYLADGSMQPMLVTALGVSQANFSAPGVAAGEFLRAAVSYAAGNFAGVVGLTQLGDGSGSPPVVDRLVIGAGLAGANPLNGFIRSIAYYPFAVSIGELTALARG